MVAFDGAAEERDLEEFEGKPDKGALSLVKSQGTTVEQGQLILDAVNQGIGPLTPDLVMKSLVKDYALAERLMGERFIRRITGYQPGYVKNNIHIPEFKRELERRVESNLEQLRKSGLLSDGGDVLEEGLEQAALSLCMEELNELLPRGTLGTRVYRRHSPHGLRDEVKDFRGERYRDLSVRGTLRVALSRGHRKLHVDDLRAVSRKSRGQCYLVYALDASGSMRGEKIAMCKKAGVALSYHAIERRDKVGLLVFGSEVKKKLEPSLDFMQLVRSIASVRAMNETNIAETVQQSITMFPRAEVTRHLIIITDALPTQGESPEERTLAAVSEARSHGITVSVIGIALDKRGKSLAKRISELGDGRLYLARTVKELDMLVLEDYAQVAETGH